MRDVQPPTKHPPPAPAPFAPPATPQTKDMHPAVVALGLKYASNTIRGANARCLAMLVAFKQVVSEYTLPNDKSQRWDKRWDNLDKKLKAVFQFLTDCRQHSISMGNAFKASGRLGGGG